ncbi:glutathione peroxidase [Aliidongia dinghuensis]|uniref:Glutathione peroxidase n=1 Tax=Aliidongia dinghuensis TaxID=1867774 RepID=A0A8J3E0X7_9PROT|nr:glutathione peroxidase [Aliidongia dinghuensis]GGF05817.1 glutathione peroxidase [Aliidongia dinghuensis]
MADGKTAYDFSFRTLQGEPFDLVRFRGRPLVVVNTASKCGFTPQYAGLTEVWRRHKDQGLVIIGVPSNDFGAQEPGEADEIASFCEINYGVDFPMTEKVHVRGPAAHPLFRWLAAEGGFFSRPRWNFYKYLIGRDGRLKTWFLSPTKPDSGRFDRAVRRVIGPGDA